MRTTGSATRLTVFVDEDDTWHHRPLATEIIHRAHAAGLAGATVFKGVEGYGSSFLIHTSRLLSMSEHLPAAVVIVDSDARIRAFLPELDEIVGDGLVLLDRCEAVWYTAGGAPGS